jgi:hypothetical protein
LASPLLSLFYLISIHPVSIIGPSTPLKHVTRISQLINQFRAIQTLQHLCYLIANRSSDIGHVDFLQEFYERLRRLLRPSRSPPAAFIVDVEKAYYVAERKHHPRNYPADKYAEAAAAFIPYRDAYDTLTNYPKRCHYHRTYIYKFMWDAYQKTPVIHSLTQMPNPFWVEFDAAANDDDEVLYPN